MSGFFSKLKNALSKTSSKIGNSIENLFVKKRLDEKTLEELEDLLICSDVGVEVSGKIISSLRKSKFDKEVTSDEIKKDVSSQINEILSLQDHKFKIQSDKLNIILVCGVNGNGKTTTIGKMSSLYKKQGKKIAIAACDTFRAAAIEQLETWSDRSGSLFFKGKEKADPASVAYVAVTESIKENVDILFIDTAGRLHNHKNLMEELAKINRIINKVGSSANYHSLLVIDGTTGQNASVQVEEFKKLANISGLVITKLDGTAKAGSVIGIVEKFKIPVNFIGIGESIDDLKEFSTKDFSDAIVGISDVKTKL